MMDSPILTTNHQTEDDANTKMYVKPSTPAASSPKTPIAIKQPSYGATATRTTSGTTSASRTFYSPQKQQLMQNAMVKKKLSKLEKKRKQINEVWVMCEAQYQMHRLSTLYFAYRHYQYYTLPLSIITMTSGIMAFAATTSSSIVHDTIKQYLSLAVGCSAILSAFIQKVGQEAKYEPRSEMHKNASLGMKKITEQLEFYQLEVSYENECDIKDDGMKKERELMMMLKQPQSTQNNDDDAKNQHVESFNNETNPNDQEQEEVEKQTILLESEQIAKQEKNIAMFTEMYQQCLESCQSEIPIRIAQAFKMADTRLAVSLTREDKMTIRREYGYLGKLIVHRCLYNEVFCSISDHAMFPRDIPRPEGVVLEVMKEVGRIFQGSSKIVFDKMKRNDELV